MTAASERRPPPSRMSIATDADGRASSELPRVDPPAKNVAPKVDPWLLQYSGGRLSMGLIMPSAVLTTVGAKTGKPRSNPVFYFHDGPDVIVIASNYGNDKNPSWYYNLKANPRVEIAKNGDGPPMNATEIVDPAERDRIWALADRVYPLWPDYRRRAAQSRRTIPIIRLVAA